MLQEIRCAYMLIIMATYWITEALPLAVTALLPIIMVPLLSIMGSKEICPNYAKVSTMHYSMLVRLG